jgi:predicted HNH restriction endonuclease
MQLNEKDISLLSFLYHLEGKAATGTQIKNALKYTNVGAVNLHVVDLAKKLASTFSYTPTIRANNKEWWWPCLFTGKQIEEGYLWTLKPDVSEWFENYFYHESVIEKVKLSLNDNVDARRKRLSSKSADMKEFIVQLKQIRRNADVVAEALYLANGICQKCKKDAPFLTKNDRRPYLEVHHVIPLSQGGKDGIENVLALCPNCHREIHYG